MAKKTNKDRLPIMIIFVGAVVLAVFGYMAMQPKANKVAQNEQTTPTTKIDVTVENDPTPKDVSVPKADWSSGELKFENSDIKIPPQEEPKRYLLNHYLADLSFVPSDARVKTVKVENGIAHVDFASSIFAGYGSEDEATLINGVMKTLQQFKDVKYVQILVDGEKIETLGNIEIQDPLPLSDFDF